jgi:hypothetical protein
MQVAVGLAVVGLPANGNSQGEAKREPRGKEVKRSDVKSIIRKHLQDLDEIAGRIQFTHRGEENPFYIPPEKNEQLVDSGMKRIEDSTVYVFVDP